MNADRSWMVFVGCEGETEKLRMCKTDDATHVARQNTEDMLGPF